MLGRGNSRRRESTRNWQTYGAHSLPYLISRSGTLADRLCLLGKSLKVSILAEPTLSSVLTRNIDGNLSGYHKKKYVCKVVTFTRKYRLFLLTFHQLLYIYILGWNVDFGHLEAVNLISANKYSEKQIGYLAMTLFLHEEHELLHLVVNSIRKDLTDHNELFNCLALHAIANVGGREMGEALSGEVHRLLISPYDS